MVIAPLDANTLAKIANGICDNLLVSKSAIGFSVVKTFMLKFPFCYHCMTFSETEFADKCFSKYVLNC